MTGERIEIETAAIHLAVLEEYLSTARDEQALLEASYRVSGQLTGKNEAEREAQLLLICHGAPEWEAARGEVHQCKANVETARAQLERLRMKRQEWLWIMRFLTTSGIGPVDEL